VRWSPGRRGWAGGLCAVVLAAAAAGGCGSPEAGTAGPEPVKAPVTDPGTPLDTALSTAGGTWALLAMGHTGAPLETFWQAFYRPRGATRWYLRTPEGVADNGGLVATSAGANVVIGVLASDLLHFSPLAVTGDGGVTFTPGLLPTALAAEPDALSVGAGGQAVALAGTEVLAASAGLTSWRPVTSVAAMRSDPAAAGCAPVALTAVVLVARTPTFGLACARVGTVGVLRRSAPSRLVAVGPRLAPAERGDRAEVVRLVGDGDGVAALIRLAGPRPGYLAAWDRGGTGAWRLSSLLPAAAPLVSTAATAGTFAVVTGRAQRREGFVIGPGSPEWRRLPQLPPATVTVATDGTVIDALTVEVATFADFRLVSGRWEQQQRTGVPISFGSSS
jgi:hypothetical protein